MVSRKMQSMIVGSSWLVLIGLCSALFVDAYSTSSSVKSERNLKKGKGSYYGSKGSYYPYYGSKGSYYSKSSKKQKDCKSAKKKYNYYGDYDHCFEEVPIDGNFTDIDDMLMDDAMIEVSKSWKSKGSKGSKGGYYSKSEKKDKKDEKKLNKKKSKGIFHRLPTPSPVKPSDPKSPDVGFKPDESWNLTFKDAADTGFLFYDSITKYAWYAYNAKFGEDSATVGRVCPMDTVGTGKVLEDLCIEIKAPEDWTTVTSTKIQSVEACYGDFTGAIFKLAVIVEDSSKILHLENKLVGSRLIVYDIVVSGKMIVAEPIIVEAAYKDWKSLYGEPNINGRPTFTPGCKQVYSTWLVPDAEVPGGYNSITVANDVESATKDGETSELWRLGTTIHLPGLTASKDGKSLFSATNIAMNDDLNAGGMLALNAKNGQIIQQYVFPTNAARLPNNAYTNLVLDDSGNSYHIDSLLGLVKFDFDDLNDGPVWTALGTATKSIGEGGSRKLAPLVATRDADSKMLEAEKEKTAEDMPFTAFKPALDGKNPTVAYGCGTGSDGVVALGAAKGETVWFTEFDDIHSVDVGSCGGITHDIVYGPASASSSGSAVYLGRGKLIQALDSKDGSLLWTYDTKGPGGAAQFVVVSGEFVLAANAGTIYGLDTTKPIEPTASPVAPPTNTQPSLPPTNSPTRKPLSTPSPVMPAPFNTPTPEPTKASSGRSNAFGASFAVAVSMALPLLVLLR